MKRVEDLSLRLRVFLFFAALALGNIAAIVAGLWFGYARLGNPEVLNALIIGARWQALLLRG